MRRLAFEEQLLIVLKRHFLGWFLSIEFRKVHLKPWISPQTRINPVSVLAFNLCPERLLMHFLEVHLFS